MRIAYILAEYPSLSETFIAREIEALGRRGFDVDIWALRAGKGARQIPVSKMARALTKLRDDEHHWQKVGESWARRERDLLKSVQHIHAGWASFPAEIAWGAGKVLGVPWSFTGHARDLWVEGKLLPEKLRAARFATSCTRAGARYLQSQIAESPKKVLYAPHGVEIAKYPFRAERTLHSPVRALAVGRLVEKKGFLVLLEALAQLQKEGVPVQLTFIGEGPQRGELEKKIAQLGLDARLLGAQAHETVIEAMQQSDIFVMPSIRARDGDSDGLPNVLLEAAACGLPIVSTREGAITDFLDESCAWLCAPGEAEALKQALQNAVQNYAQALEKARKAHERVSSNFEIERNIEVLAQALKEWVG